MTRCADLRTKRRALPGLIVFAASHAALACDTDATAVFACEAAQGRKFIELCAAADLQGPEAYLQYRFGALNAEGREAKAELEFPAQRQGSLKRFFGATYTRAGVYTQSVRFVQGDFSYTVFTEARGHRELGAGVQVRHLASGKTSTVSCSERPRFYIFELKGLLACDEQAPGGRACIQ